METPSQDITPIYGIVVLGAPGVGKTTFCNGLQQFLNQLQRPHAMVNLDPANDNMSYEVSYFYE